MHHEALQITFPTEILTYPFVHSQLYFPELNTVQPIIFTVLEHYSW